MNNHAHLLNDITSETLWVVWDRTPDIFLKLDPTQQPIGITWLLASKGHAGLEEIMVDFPAGFIAAASLATLEVAYALLSTSSDAHPSWVRSALGLRQPESFVLGRDAVGNVRIMSKGEVQADTQVLLSGSIDDLKALIDKGRETLAGSVPNWRAIYGDVRSYAQTKPVKWFDYQRDPMCASYLEKTEPHSPP